jgi:5'(3')-deoxyribonucleotidase
MFSIDEQDVIHTHAKHVVNGDLFVDDKPEHIVAWGAKGRKTSAFLWDTHRNQMAEGLPRLSNWDELDELLESRGL